MCSLGRMFSLTRMCSQGEKFRDTFGVSIMLQDTQVNDMRIHDPDRQKENYYHVSKET
jgi:hypothetical protein